MLKTLHASITISIRWVQICDVGIVVNIRWFRSLMQILELEANSNVGLALLCRYCNWRRLIFQCVLRRLYGSNVNWTQCLVWVRVTFMQTLQ